jgi:DNA-binding NarL/FixJ family response regulator
MSKTVICIDDSPYILKRLTSFLKDEMHLNIVATGKDGTEAVKLYKKHLPDLMTLDISMPNKPGDDVAAEIMAQYPTANILMVTAVHGEQLTRCIASGAKASIFKPLKFDNPDYVANFKAIVNRICPQ